MTPPPAPGRADRRRDIYSIVKFFQLCMENNPNMVDALYTPASMVVQSTQVGQLVKESRDLFLHKGCWHKFKGYAYSQLHKIDIKNPEPGSKRAELVEQYGYDVKFAYHVVRLMQEVEMILAEGTLDLVRCNEVLKAIRRGEWTEAQIRQYFTDKERQLEDLYHKSALPISRTSPGSRRSSSNASKCTTAASKARSSCRIGYETGAAGHQRSPREGGHLVTNWAPDFVGRAAPSPRGSRHEPCPETITNAQTHDSPTLPLLRQPVVFERQTIP